MELFPTYADTFHLQIVLYEKSFSLTSESLSSLNKELFKLYILFTQVAIATAQVEINESQMCACLLQFPEFVTSFFSRLSWPTTGSPPSAPTRNIVGNVPSYAGRQVEASVFLNAFIQIFHCL